tara:strand:- start:570 stop:1661 length:1092 start_codon:yes stop_codon:yes gene_type:complete
VHLILFFTRDLSLKDWDVTGNLSREIALYKRLLNLGINITFITYGSNDDLKYKESLHGITILCNKWGLSNRYYSKYLHILHWKALRNCHIIKTNQMNGAELALKSALFWKKPLIARCGYMWSQFAEKENGPVEEIKQIENNVFNLSRNIFVTTSRMKKNIINRLPQNLDKTIVIPNYVDTNIFKPNLNINPKYEIIFIGRLSKQKNLKALLYSIGRLNIRALIIGNGPLRSCVEELIKKSEGKVKWFKSIPNSELPTFINNAKIFILPSFYEGHPKTLIEAMSCGIPVIGANSPGIKEIIIHKENGYLCELSLESIEKSIKYLINNPDLCLKLGENGRQYIIENFSLDQIVNQEVEVYNNIIN